MFTYHICAIWRGIRHVTGGGGFGAGNQESSRIAALHLISLLSNNTFKKDNSIKSMFPA
jgi:hypothetical protein